MLPDKFKLPDADTDDLSEYSESERQLKLKPRITEWLIWQADRTPMNQRPWFRISEIADYCARVPGSLELDQSKREQSIEVLRKAILTGEFDDSKGRSKIANLHTHRRADLCFARNSAAESEFSRQCVSYLWIRRADCEAWFKRNGIEFPKSWSKAEAGSPPKRKGGRKPKFEHLIHGALVELFDWHGDLRDDDPEWSTQADVEKAVRTKLGDKAPSAVSTVRRYVSKFIADWKGFGPEGR
jgi:hypothetical protein